MRVGLRVPYAVAVLFREHRVPLAAPIVGFETAVLMSWK
jgi:hypothetical protein